MIIRSGRLSACRINDLWEEDNSQREVMPACRISDLWEEDNSQREVMPVRRISDLWEEDNSQRKVVGPQDQWSEAGRRK